MNANQGMLLSTILSGAANLALLSDMKRIEKKSDRIIEEIQRANLIATLLILKKQETNMEESKMKKTKKFGSKFSNRTKVAGITTLLLSAATVALAARDLKQVEVEPADVLEEATETITDVAEEITDTAEEIFDEM